MTDTTCPPLPSGSVDFAVLQAAALKNADLGAAMAAANGAAAAPAPAPASEPEAAPVAEPEAAPAATGKK